MTHTCPDCHATVLSTSQPDPADGNMMRAALEECAARCRYDGDLFHDQGNEMRRDASWRAADMANAALAATPAEDMVPKHLLNERDDFIVAKGLWSEFTASLAAPPPFQPHENCNCLMCLAEKPR